jgi:hypothetical protein
MKYNLLNHPDGYLWVCEYPALIGSFWSPSPLMKKGPVQPLDLTSYERLAMKNSTLRALIISREGVI